MSLMYSLQICVELVPFATAHDSDILSHTEVYIPFSQFQIVQWPSSSARAGRKVTQVLLISCAINASFLVSTHTSTRWAFDNILTSTHAREAFSTTNKSHMHANDIGNWQG